VIVNSIPIVPFTVSLGISEYPELSTVFEELKGKIKNLVVIDAQKVAKEAGNIISENMVLLGAAIATPNFPVDKELIIQSMKENLSPETIKTNLKAFEMGFAEVKN
jgi:indolepyruvate ferredoxin oxidoreductase beta subunit